jgi:hypothetical protein
MFLVLRQNVDSHKFKDDCKVGTVEMKQLITADGLLSTENGKVPPTI